MDGVKHCATCSYWATKAAFNDSQTLRECLSPEVAGQMRAMATIASLRGRITSVAVEPDFSCKHWELKRT